MEKNNENLREKNVSKFSKKIENHIKNKSKNLRNIYKLKKI